MMVLRMAINLRVLARSKKFILGRKDLEEFSKAIENSPKAQNMTFGQLFGGK